MKKQQTMIHQLRLSVFFMAALVVAAAGAKAQEQQAITGENKLTPKFGIKGGLNLTSLYVDDVSSEHMKVGFNAGIFAKLPVTKGFSIQPELLYSVKGAKDTYSKFVQGDGEYRFNLGYMELPVLAVVNITPNFNIHAGPYVGYLVSAKVKDVKNDGSIEGASDLKADNFNRWDVGLAG
ncbi:MAG: porin family protein, partial [Bacteroidota bacterium]